MTIASQAAIAVSKANIFQEKKKRLNELEAIHEISKEISAITLDIKSVLKAIIRRAVELSGAEHGTILLCDHENQKLKVVVTHNLDILLGISIAFGVGLAGQVAKDGKTRIRHRYHQWKNRAPIFKQEKYKDLIKAVAQVPLKSGGRVLGVLAVSSSDDKRIFTKDDTRLLNSFAGPAAIALNNAKTLSYSQTLIKNTPHAIIAVDRKGRVIEFNRASENILGYRPEEVLGGLVDNLYWKGREVARRINKLLLGSEEGKISDVETSVRSKAGEEIPIRFSGSLLYDVMGERIGSVGIVEDLRAIRRLEQKYRALYEVGKVGVEVPEYEIEKICREFMEVLTKRVMKFKAASLSLVNEDGKLEKIALSPNIKMEKTNDHLKFAGKSSIQKQDCIKIPLKVRNRDIGEITVFKEKDPEFTVEEKEFLERFASLAALVIEKAKDIYKTKRTSVAIHEIAHDVVDLSGEDVYGEIWHKLTYIISRKIPGTGVALYRCDHGTGQSASLMQTTSQDLYRRLKKILNPGESPYQTTSDIISDYLFLPARGSGQSDRLEGFLLVEKIPQKDDMKAKFSGIDSIILNMLASAVGIALFRQRRDTRQGLKKRY